jgi:dephospho-CoA kinase
MSDGRQRPVFIGLTGAVAAGKSTSLAELEKLGVPTLSTDQVVHQIYADREVINLVADRLGNEVIQDRAVNRDAVARKVFNEPEARVWLEQLIWPRVGQQILDWRKRHEAVDEPPPAIVVEVPLLFESGMDQAFDCTIVVTVDDALRRDRAAQRGHEELEARDARHLTQQQKSERADVVVVNDGSVEHLGRQMAEAIKTCRKLAVAAQ